MILKCILVYFHDIYSLVANRRGVEIVRGLESFPNINRWGGGGGGGLE